MLGIKEDSELKQYFKESESWHKDIYLSLTAAKNRAWLITYFSMGISLLSLLTLLALLPLKTFEPYLVTLDNSTGYLEVTKTLAAGTLTQDEAVTQSNLVRYVSGREAYNPAVLKENYDFIALLSESTALEEFKYLWDAANPDNPSIILGADTAIDIKIKSVSLLNHKTASVRFLREQHSHGQIRTSHWNALIEFHYVQSPLKMAERFKNPLGFKVTSYRINPEGLETIK